MALVPFALPVMLGLAFLGPAAADLQDLAGPARRRIAIGICFLCVNVLGYGIAPPIIGKLGDLLDVGTHPELMSPSLLVCPSQPSSRRPCCTSRAARSRSRSTSDSGPQGRSATDSRDSLRCTSAEGDIGVPRHRGFDGRHLADDPYVRWAQLGVFAPALRLHSNHGDRLPGGLRGVRAHGCCAVPRAARGARTPRGTRVRRARDSRKKSRSTTRRCCAGTPAVPTARAPSRTAEAQA